MNCRRCRTENPDNYDLGTDEEAGLLGNDFLRHFQVDLDSIKGVLKLMKK